MKPLSRRSRFLLLVGSAAAIGAVATVALHRAPRDELDVEVSQLETELAALSKITPAATRHARELQAQSQRSLWSRERFERWKASIPPGWTLTELGDPETKSVTLRRFALERAQATFDDWSEITRVLEQIAGQPGLTLRSLTLASAPRPARVFRQVLAVATIAFPLAPKSTPGAAPPATEADPRAGSPAAENLAPKARQADPTGLSGPE